MKDIFIRLSIQGLAIRVHKDKRIEEINASLSVIKVLDEDFIKKARQALFDFNELKTVDIPAFLDYCFALGGKDEGTLRAIIADLAGSVFDWISSQDGAEEKF